MIFKFRVWDVEQENMHYEEELSVNFYQGDVYVEIDTHPDVDIYTLWDFEIMQSTGLLDINGKEIYEGDIILIELIDSDPKYVNVRSYLGHVIYDDGVFDVKPSGAPTGIIPELYLSGHNYQIKLLGNIYENKELLEEIE